jgi:hypothetical protein
MTRVERAAQIWSTLALAARNRQTLTYDMLGRLTGTPRMGLGQLLEPVQSYCLVQRLPPLTALVVSGRTGLPGLGFIAAQDVPRTQQEVFAFDWLGHGSPSLDALDRALRELPSNETSEGSDDEVDDPGEPAADTRQLFGSINSLRPSGLDNEQIDADLAAEYGNTHEGG